MPEADAQQPAGAVDVPTDPNDNETGDTSPDTAKMSDTQIASYMKSRAESSERVTKSLYPEWKRNVELRIGHVASLYTGGIDVQDEIQTEINPDWSLTKTKTANLYSQVPTVRLTHENSQFAPAIPPFAKALNYEIGPKRSNIGPPMEEILNDMVNAAGVGAIFTGYAARFIDKLVPAIETGQIPPEVMGQLTETELPEGTQLTPETVGQMLLNRQLPMTRQPQVASDRIFSRRVSPIDLLWPSEFTGSDFDEADFMGYKGRDNWASIKLEFNLTDADYENIVTGNNDTPESSLRSNPEKAGLAETKTVKFKDLYYWRARVDPDEKSFHCIWRIVFIDGMDKPAYHGPWKGQKLIKTPGGVPVYIGNHRFPVQVCTLTYISDNPIPPSDSSAGRPQVNDMRRSRRDMFNNRERSIPLRWFDVNRIDQTIQTMLMQGTWQGMIPTNGDGSRSIGEIARASYPAENMAFDQQAQQDLLNSWQISPNQNSGVVTDETATAANIGQQHFATRIGQERNRVAQFFLRNVELVAGYMVLYSDFPVLTQQERQAMMQAWDQKSILHDLVFKILPDSQVVLDSNARIQKLVNFLNITVKSGYVNPKPIIIEIAELSGIDPNEVVVDPQPPKSEDPKMSITFTGKEDLTNALVLATLLAGGKVPSIQQVEHAKQLIIAAGSPAQTPGANGAPGGPEGEPGAPPPAPGTPPAPAGGHDAHPDWHTASKVAQRSEDTNG